MSWAEVFKINSNMKKPLNEQLRDIKHQPIRIITATGAFTPEKNGLYKVICVGAGGNGSHDDDSNYVSVASGGGGGVAISILRLDKTHSYNVTVGTTASFTHESGSLTATAGGNGDADESEPGIGGSASGGDFNYPGLNGSYIFSTSSNKLVTATPGSVGVFISDLSRRGDVEWVILNSVARKMTYGDSIITYGGAGNGFGEYMAKGASMHGLPAAVIIIPVEMEE